MNPFSGGRHFSRDFAIHGVFHPNQIELLWSNCEGYYCRIRYWTKPASIDATMIYSLFPPMASQSKSHAFILSLAYLPCRLDLDSVESLFIIFHARSGAPNDSV